MKARLLSSVSLVLVLFVASQAVGEKLRRAKSGISKRVQWTTSKIDGTPEPPDPYLMEVAFPTLKFDMPLAMSRIPKSNRLVIGERYGKIFSFIDDRKRAKKQLILDVKHTVYGVAIHPNFQKNGYIYVTYVLDPMKTQPKGTRVSRFTCKKKNPPVADLSTEEIVLEWPSGGHNGGCMRFGPDGYLYIVTGDGSGIADGLQTGQDISDLLGAILRIDVNKKSKGRNYSIPKDNPFANRKGARGEIYSYGHRQVWKFSFDRMTGKLWAGEVGQDLWEMVYIIKKGGNYGWSVREGNYPFRPERKKGPTPFEKPIVEHPHSDFRSITGGYVYHASRLSELQKAYVYADYDTGKVWVLKYENGKVKAHQQLTDTQLRLVAFGQDRQGEVYAVDFIGGQLHWLKRAPKQKKVVQFPRKLSETGLFASTRKHQPMKGLIPYTVNSPLWSDGATKERFIAVPGNGKIEFETVTYPQPAPGSEPGWRFPHNTVLVKTFFLEMEAGNPNSRRRLETRILHHKRMPGSQEVGTQFWRGYTYVWNDAQTDAMLLDTKGLNRTYTIKDKNTPGGTRKQVWRFPSRAECTLCHTMSAKYSLGVNTLQMNKDHNYGGVVANQLSTLSHIGLFTKKLQKSPNKMKRIVDYRDKSKSINLRARGYLHANCSHCHRKWGGGNAEFQLLASLPLKETGTLGVNPGQGKFKLNRPSILSPGSPKRSMISFRMKKTGLGRMPHIASHIIDKEAVELIDKWIKTVQKNDARSGVVER